MRDKIIVPLATVSLIAFMTVCLLAIAACNRDTSKENAMPTETAKTAQSPANPSTDMQKQHQEAEQKFRPEIEAQRQQSQKEAEQTLDQDAIAAIDQTEAAIKAISANNKGDALAAIERATGKINILLARNPSTALIPVSVEVVVIDTAPADPKLIDQIVQAATDATRRRALPAARLLLASVVSELRIRTTSIPLATYPIALQEAARLLDQGKNQDAGKVLLTALNTLALTDHVIPLPLLLAQAAIEAANSQRQNKDAALALLRTAREETDRSRRLGYLSDDSEYKALDHDIASLESAVKGQGDTGSLFSRLSGRISAFIKRQKEHAQR
jgi:hypothetical protein